jgi:hypothetical protein
MPDDEYFFFTLPPNNWRKKPGPSTFKMTIEDAAKRYPGAEPILSSREVRLGGDPITADSPYCKRLRPKTPEEEAYHLWLISRIGATGE